MTHFKTLLLAYRRIDVRIGAGWLGKKRFVHELSEEEMRDGLDSFRAFPSLVKTLSEGEAAATHEIVIVEEPLSSVTREDGETYWPSPDDTRKELDAFAPTGRYDSVFVYWPQINLSSGAKIPCRGWGLGRGPSEWTNGATYAVVANAASWAWKIPIVGEVWLHEWLHGVCRIFAEKGFAMPEYDADGGGSHGYIQSETTGWTSFYRDLMTGQVVEDGEKKGITAGAWRSRVSSGTWVI